MSIWFFIWFVLSAIIIGANLWSWIILIKQKNAWEKFALQHKMTFRRGKFLAPAEIEGLIGQYRFTLFTGQRQGQDVRQRRLVTVMELGLPEGLVDGAAIGTSEMNAFMGSIETLSPLMLDNEKWNKDYRIYARNEDLIRLYLTDERIEHINQILGTKNSDNLLLFDDREAVLRLETPSPLLETGKIDAIVRRLMTHCEALRVSKAERKALIRQAQMDEEAEEETKTEKTEDNPIISKEKNTDQE